MHAFACTPGYRLPRTRRALQAPTPCCTRKQSQCLGPQQEAGEAAPLLPEQPLPPSPPPWDVFAFVSDRLAADSRFLQKITIEVTVDSACTLVAELTARGAAAFGRESPFLVDDLLTTVLLDVAMLSVLAPSQAKLAASNLASQSGARKAFLDTLPSSCFAPAPPPLSYSLQQRAAAAVYTALLYGALGLVCGGAGQALTNSLTEAQAAGPQLPGVGTVASLWGYYMATSASLRYQAVGAAENLAERILAGSASRLAVLPLISLLLRLGNNVYGAGEFVELMKDNSIT